MNNKSAPFSLKPLDKTFGAIIDDVCLSKIDDDGFKALYATWLQYGLLVFPGQNLSKQEQIAFASRFGKLIAGLEAATISNIKPDGSLRDAPDDDMMKIIRGNMHWHQDNTYMPIQAKGAVFSAKIVPTEQGGTAFADMRAAYASLDSDTRQLIGTLSTHHSLARSQQRLGETVDDKTESEYSGYGLDVEGAPLRPMVKIHPETGIPSLALGRHAYGIPDWSEKDSESLISELINFAVSDPARVYQHQWRPGDVVVWDNRCLMHRACAWNYEEPRVMLHSRIAGDPKTEGCVN